MTTHPTRSFVPSRLRHGLCVLLITAAAAVALARIVAAVAIDGGDQAETRCQPILHLMESFDGVTPPALPTGWSSTTWETSNSGVPTPPADTPPNAAFVVGPATISDKQLLSPNIPFVADAAFPQLAFRNNFNLQDGFDGGVLEISYDGLTFQDIVAAGGTFVRGGYNGTISSCCGNPLAGREAWTGNSGGFIDTTVNLPHHSGSYNLRWRMGSDSSVSGEGWRVDNIVITQCYTPRGPRGQPTPHPRPTP